MKTTALTKRVSVEWGNQTTYISGGNKTSDMLPGSAFSLLSFGTLLAVMGKLFMGGALFDIGLLLYGPAWPGVPSF